MEHHSIRWTGTCKQSTSEGDKEVLAVIENIGELYYCQVYYLTEDEQLTNPIFTDPVPLKTLGGAKEKCQKAIKNRLSGWKWTRGGLDKRTCKSTKCNNTFFPWTAKQQYCSEACKKAMQKEQRKLNGKCVDCGRTKRNDSTRCAECNKKIAAAQKRRKALVNPVIDLYLSLNEEQRVKVLNYMQTLLKSK